MAAQLFDATARRLRRDRAARSGAVLFVHERAFADIMERLAEVSRTFSSTLLIGTPDPSWPVRLAAVGGSVTAVDPGRLFAARASGRQQVEAALDFDPASFDLIVAAGTLDTVNDLADVLLRLRFLLRPDSLLIGVVAGGETLPQLRRAMRAADWAVQGASPHVHPRIQPAGLAGLLSSAGLTMAVVDVDRVKVAYTSLRSLVNDLRGMAATNILEERSPRPLGRAALAAAEREFSDAAEDGRTVELFELLHFAAWTPGSEQTIG